jgi:GxxExxY protein
MFARPWRLIGGGGSTASEMADDSRSTVNEPGPEYAAAAHAVIGAAIEVHRHLGPGYLEIVYEKALEVEMIARSIRFERRKKIQVFYKGQPVGRGQLDFLVEDILVVELKAVEMIAPIHQAQVISYLKTMDRPLGLLINFRVPLLKDGVRRIVLSGGNRQGLVAGPSD